MEFISSVVGDCRCTDGRAWLRFIRDKRWGRRVKHRLLNTFVCPCNIYSASDEELSPFNESLQRKAKSVDSKAVEQDFVWLSQADANLITFNSDAYPAQLRQIDDPPIALFALGDIELMKEPQVSIVGSRRPTPIGTKLAQSIAHDLSQLGLVITSGMALGIDGLSHLGALNCNGNTIAVLGNGLNVIYPSRHRQMYERIRAKGLLLSEYPPDVRPTKYTFPERNRIVSGLSLGVVIIEAASKSGTLITARFALEQNKEVMVIPGAAVSKQYEGSHSLLRDGAALVTCANDVLHVLGYVLSDLVCQPLNVIEVDGDDLCGELRNDAESDPLLKLIGAEPISVDEIILNSGLTPAEVSSMLLVLELEGKIILGDNGGYINLG